MERTARRRTTVVALVASGMAVALAVTAFSCQPASRPTGEAAEDREAGGGPSPADLAALDVPGDVERTTTTGPDDTGTLREPGGTTTATGPPSGGDAGGSGSPGADATTSVPPASAGDCAALSQVAIPPASIITQADFTPAEDRAPDPVGRAADLAAARRVAQIVPADQRPAWDAAVAALAGGPGAPSTGATVPAARNASEVWARAACPGAPPSWRCDEFGSIGPGPDVAPTRAEAASPLGALHRSPDTGAAVELQRTPDIVLYGWVDASGFVTRTHQVERIDGGWATARRHVCHDLG